MVNDTSRRTASFCPPLMYSLVTSRAISMYQALVAHSFQLREIRRAVAIGVFGTIVACGSGSAANVQNQNATGVSKNNMGTSKSSAVRSESTADVKDSVADSAPGSTA